MTQNTSLPARPDRGSSVQQQIGTVWETFYNFIRDVYDAFVNSFANNTAIVLVGNTTVVVTHSLGKATYIVSLTPKLDPGGRYWVTGKTSTQFTINLQVAAPGGGIPFDWMVKAI